MHEEGHHGAPKGSKNPFARAIRVLLRKTSKWCFGYDVWSLQGVVEARHQQSLQRLESQGRQVVACQNRLELLEKVLEAAGDAPEALWLFAHRQERMDATMPFFDATRRAFHLERYVFAGRHVAGKRVLDVACGPGYGAGLLRQKGAVSVVGADIDPAAAKYARTVHGAAGVRFVCADAARLPLPDASVDVVTSFETVEHIQDDRTFLSEVSRVLVPGGRFICSTPNQWPLEQAPYHVREYDRNTFENALSVFFGIDEMYNQNSGSDSLFNRRQPAGILPTTPENESCAECFIAVCTKP
jgi:ubiquinone/menaquinone biosynthesis C-methylase UbiE